MTSDFVQLSLLIKTEADETWLASTNRPLGVSVVPPGTMGDLLRNRPERQPVDPLDLATTLFGPDPGERPDPHLLGKLWCKFRSGRDSEVEVRIGWLAGREYIQIAERLSGENEYGPTI